MLCLSVASATAGTISGRVTVASSGDGLPNVTIMLFSFSDERFFSAATTDGMGNFTTSDLAPGTYAVITHNFDGYINEIYDNVQCSAVCDVNVITPLNVTADPITNVNFALEPGGRIAGTITDAATGFPIAGVTVNFVDPGGNVFFTTATTNPMGQYVSNGGTAAGNVFIVTENNIGYRNEVYNNIYCNECDIVDEGTPVPVAGTGTTGGINFALDLGGRITGNVTNAGGTPLAGVGIIVADSSGNDAEFAETDAMGNFSTSGLPAGNFYVATQNVHGLVDEVYNNITCYGFCNSTTGTAIPVTVGNTASGINFVLAEGGLLSGTVTAAAGGAPLDGIFVGIFNASGTFLGGTNTQDDGTYSLRLPPANYFASVTNPGGGYGNQLYNGINCPGFCNTTTGTPIAVAVGTPANNINFALVIGGIITGTITEAATTNPVNGMTVQLHSTTGSFLSSVSTNASGVYSFTGVSTGSYYVRTNGSGTFLINQAYNGVTCINCNVSTVGATQVAVTAGSTTGNINFALASGGRISGNIINASTMAGLQGVNAQIVTSANLNVASFTTDASGNFSTSGLPAGTYYVRTTNTLGYINKLYNDLPCTLSCTANTGTAVVVTVNTLTPNINFALDQGGRISGRITNVSTGNGVQNVSAQIYNSSGTFIGSVNSDASGNFTTSGLPAGTYFSRTFNNLAYVDQLYNGLTCTLGNCNSTITSGTAINVTVGSITPNINYSLTQGGRIGGQVLNNATGAGISGFVPVIYDSAGVPIGGSNADAGGNYLTAGLPPGNYFVFAGPLGFVSRLYNNRPCPQSCTITSGDAVAVTAGNTTSGINFRLNTAFTFTDSTLTEQTTSMKAAHITELRTNVNLVRQQVGLSAFTFTDDSLSAGVTAIKAVHIEELRTALDAVYDALAITRPTYTDATLVAGVTPVKAVHISELRNAVLAVH